MTAKRCLPAFTWPVYSNQNNNEFLKQLKIGAEVGIRYLAYVTDGQHKETRFGISKTGIQRHYKKIYRQNNLDSSLESVFFTPNQFSEKRSKHHILSFSANWLDIDLKLTKGVVLDFTLESLIYDQVLTAGEQAGLPAPTAIVLSGSGGLHLYWIYNAVDTTVCSTKKWESVTRKLMSAFNGQRLWFVDYGASIRCSGLMRLPGSINPKTGKRVVAEYGGPVYDFDKLCELLDVSDISNVVRFNPKINDKIQQEAEPKTRVSKHSICQWWFSCYLAVCSHFRKIGKVPEGKRDKTAFILFVALRKFKKKEDALEEIKIINRELIGLSEHELKNNLSTAYEVSYKYSKSTLIDYLQDLLDYVPEYLNAAKPEKLTTQEIKDRQKQAAAKTAKLKVTKTEENLKEAFKRLKAAGGKVTQDELSSYTKISIRTVKRYWGQI